MSVSAHLGRFHALLDALAVADPTLEPRRCVDLAVELLDAANDAVEAIEWDTPPELAERARRAYSAAESIGAAGVAAGWIESARLRAPD